MNTSALFALAQYYEHIYVLYSLKRDRETLLKSTTDPYTLKYAKVDGMTLSMLNCAIEGKQLYVSSIEALPADSELHQTKAELDDLCDFFDVYYMPGRGKVAQMLMNHRTAEGQIMTIFANMTTCQSDEWELEGYDTRFEVRGEELVCMDRLYKLRKFLG